MRTYPVVSQHTCERAVNGSIPLGGSTAPIPLLGSEFLSVVAGADGSRAHTPLVGIHGACRRCEFRRGEWIAGYADRFGQGVRVVASRC